MQQYFGKYEVLRELGRGAMGVVYEALDPNLKRRVAIKTIRYDQFEAGKLGETLARLKIEAQAGARFSHPNIVQVFDYAESPATESTPGFAFIAMEFVSGRSLKDVFDIGDRIDIHDSTRIILQILAGLEHAHAHGVYHRDIKPANIILLAGGNIKIADFGIARIEDSDLTQVGTVMGTPSYMSPEQFRGQPVDHRTDIYSAGVLLYELLTGEKPFTGSYAAIMQKVLNETPLAPTLLNGSLAAHWDAIIKRALAKNVGDRYQSAAEFGAAISAGGAEEDPDATIINAPSAAPFVAASPQTGSAARSAESPTPGDAIVVPRSRLVAMLATKEGKLYATVGVAVVGLFMFAALGVLRNPNDGGLPFGGDNKAASNSVSNFLAQIPCAVLTVEKDSSGKLRILGSVETESDQISVQEFAKKPPSGPSLDASKVGVVPSLACEVGRELREIAKSMAKKDGQPAISLMGHVPRFEYRKKEVIPIEIVNAPFEAFLYVLYVSGDGKGALRMYPPSGQNQAKKVAASSSVLVSDPKPLMNGMVASPPAGRDLIIAISSSVRFPALENDEQVVSITELLKLVRGLRSGPTKDARLAVAQLDIEIAGP